MAQGTGFGKTILIGDQFVLDEVPAIVSAISYETVTTVERIDGEGWVLEDNRIEVPGYKEKKKEKTGSRTFSDMVEQAAEGAGVDVVVNWIGSMGTLFFTEEAVTDFDSAKRSDAQRFKSFYAGMLEQGIYLAPSAFEAWFVSAAHDHGSIQKTIRCAERSFAALKGRKIH